MADEHNPWQSPETVVKAEEHAAQGILTVEMIRSLKEASPWVRFIGILGYIGAVFLIITGIVVAIALAVSGGSRPGGFMGLVSVFMGFIYIVLGVVVFFPARFTHRFGVQIRNYLVSGAEKDLEEAFKNNKSLWKFSGVLAIVYLALIPLGIIAAVAAAVSSAF
jgi:magnesium-transporting ATPase (P-type)